MRPGVSARRRLVQGLARITIVLVLPAIVLLAIGVAAQSLGAWWLELLRYLPYPLVLGPAAFAVVLSWSLSRRWRVAAASGLALVVTVIMGLAVGRADAGSQPIRLMTYNVKAYLAGHQTGAFDALTREVERQAPDILVMEDAFDGTSPSQRLLALAGTIFKERHVYGHGQYIVVSRFPLFDCHPVDLFQPQMERKQAYVRCTVLAGDHVFDLITVHLLSPREGLNATRRERADGIDDWKQNFADRLQQARNLAAHVATRERPLVIAGDLNAAEASPVVRALLAQDLRDAFSSAGFGYGYTHGHSLRLGFSFLRIDHILVSPEIGVRNAFAGGREASEHRPVIADLLLQRSPH